MNRSLNDRVQQRTVELENARIHIIRSLGYAGEYRNTGIPEYRDRYVIRMSHYSRFLALKAGMSAAEAELLFQAAHMHDGGIS